MTYTGFRFTGLNAVATRPADKAQAVAGNVWARDRTSVGADDGTELDATTLNRLKANLEGFVAGLGGNLGDGDDQLKNAAIAYVAAQLASFAPLASPALTGIPTAPTATLGTNTTQIATMAALQAAIAALLDAPPGALDTLNELAAALGDDANFAATVTAALALKAPLASPALTGDPTAPTQSPGNNSTRIATTAYVIAELAGVSALSFNGRNGAVTMQDSDLAASLMPSVSVASAATCDVLGAASLLVTVTGSTGPITSFGTGTNRLRWVKFASTPTVNHNATSLITPTGGNIAVAAGDTWLIRSDGSSNVTVLAIHKANGHAAVEVLSSSYVSADQTITSAGTLTLAHGLGVKPKMIEFTLICQSAEFNFSVGDEIFCGPAGGVVGGTSGNPATGIAVKADATNLTLRFGSGTNVFQMQNFTSGVIQVLTNANWKLQVRAYA